MMRRLRPVTPGAALALLVATAGIARGANVAPQTAPFKAIPIPVPPTRPGEPTRELEALGFGPGPLFAWVERTGKDALLRIHDLAFDRLVLEQPWPPHGHFEALRARGIDPMDPSKHKPTTGVFADRHYFTLGSAGRSLLARRTGDGPKGAAWKKIGAVRSERVSVLGWLRSPAGRHAAVFLEDGGVRVIGVHLYAGFEAPRGASESYDQALLAMGAATGLQEDECDPHVARGAALEHLGRALERDPALKARARRDFEALGRSLSFRVVLGTIDLKDPGAVAEAIARTEWEVPVATCGGGLYDYSAHFSSDSFSGDCPQAMIERQESGTPHPAPRRYRVKGTTLLFEDGGAMELTFPGGVATITGGPYPFVEATFHCRRP